MAARKPQAKNRRKGAREPVQWRRWVKPVLAAASVLGTLAGLGLLAHWMQDPQQWPVRSVQVQGQFRHLQPQVLQAEVEPLSAAGFFAMEVGEIQAQVQQMPWVDQVSVRRVWPDRLELAVLEQRAVARWGEQGFLNRRAEVFVPDGDGDPGVLVQLDGPDGYEQRVLDMYTRLQAMLQPLGLKLSELKLDARRAWSMRLDNGLELAIGRKQPEQRVARFIRAYPAILAAGKQALQRVDLRYSNGFAVRWQQGSQGSGGTG